MAKYGVQPFGQESFGNGIVLTKEYGAEIDVPYMSIFIDGINYTDQCKRANKSINQALQEHTNTFSFTIWDYRPTDYQDVKVVVGAKVRATDTSSITLNISCNFNNLFRVGDRIFMNAGTVNEGMEEISSIDTSGDYLILNFTNNLDNPPSLGSVAGRLFFAGNVVYVNDRNIGTISNQEFTVKCADRNKLFDKENINDEWEDKDARYIINSFCNSTINKNIVLDTMDYDNNTAIQAAWTESIDGDNPEVDSSVLREGTTSGKFSWTNSSGTALFQNTLGTSVDISGYVGTSTGTPTKGILGFWCKVNSLSAVSEIRIGVGQDLSNHIRFDITPTSTDWVFYSLNFKNYDAIVGSPDFSVVDWVAVLAVESADSFIHIDGIRVLEDQFYRHYPYVEETDTIDDFQVARRRPKETMQRLANLFAWYWHIDYERYIHFYPQTTNNAPYSVTSTTENFRDLTIDIDATSVVNKQVVEGGTQVSDSTYSEAFEGDGIRREWLAKGKFKNLVVAVDKNTVTDTMEASTTTTTIYATGHGLSVGDFIVNRSRSNALRKVLTVPDPDYFTVEAVASQASGDTFSTFVVQNVGVEGLDEDSGNDFMSNFNEKSIRNAEGEDTLVAGEFISFQYNEVVPILIQRINTTSVASMQTTLGYTNGIFEKDKEIDKSIKTRSEAIALADAIIEKYGNPVITAKFKTDIHGLEPGQQILISDTTGNRNINQYFVLHRVNIREMDTGYITYDVTASSLLYGGLELFMQLLRQKNKIELDENQVIDNIIDAPEEVTVSDTSTTQVGGEAGGDETVTVADGLTTDTDLPPFLWSVSGTPDADTYWGRFEWDS